MKRFKSLEGKRLVYESYERLLELWGVDKEELDIDTPYGTTHVIISGSSVNPALLLFHGTGTNSAMDWISIIQELANHFFIVAVDFFEGAGKSEPNESFTKEFDLGLWVDEILNALNINKTNITGISYGGYMTLAYTAKSPDRVNKIVPMAFFLPERDLKTILLISRSLIACLPTILHPTEENAMKFLKKITGPNFDVSSLKKEFLKLWFYMLKYSRIKKQKEVMRFDRQAISVIRDKALFLIGDCDILAYHPSVIKTYDKYGLKYKVLKSIGHVVHMEQPELINKEFIDFLLD